MSARKQAWSVAGHIFVTSPVEDAEHCCRARVYRVQGLRPFVRAGTWTLES